MSSPSYQSAGWLNRSLKWISKKWPYALGLIGLFVFVIILTMFIAVDKVSVDPKIIGGKDAIDGKYPYMASLRYIGNHFCGGSILNKRWLLTAAHCIKKYEAWGFMLTAIVGTNRLDDKSGQKYDIEKVVPHKHYNIHKYSNDIGLIRVETDIEFNDRIKPIQLPKKDFNKDGYPVTIIGWGSTDNKGSNPNRLQEITLKIMHQYECKRIYENISIEIVESHICTFTKSGEGSCHGDSGGPLIADEIQIGVVSFGTPICAAGGPDVYTRVYTFLNWIEEHLRDLNNLSCSNFALKTRNLFLAFALTCLLLCKI